MSVVPEKAKHCLTFYDSFPAITGIQVIEEHRIIIPAASAVRNDLPGRLYGGYGVFGVEFVLVCREATRENLCARRWQVADAGTLARPLTEQTCGGEGTREALS